MNTYTYTAYDVDDQTVRYSLQDNHRALSFSEVIDLLATNPAFIDFFNSVLQSSKFSAYFFELPPVTVDSVQNDFEFVLVNSSALARVKPDWSAFADKFKSGDVASFDNLGKDARLVSPRPLSNSSNYAHLAVFLQNAPEEQKRELWACVANELKRSIGKQPIWLSTSGLGVYWLHVRICKSPKYYSYKPYTEFN